MGAIDYLASIGELYTGEHSLDADHDQGRAGQLKRAMHLVQQEELALSQALIQLLEAIPHIHIWGITERDRMLERVPTVSFTMDTHTPREIAEHLSQAGINVWDGNYYALAVTDRLGLEGQGGMLRVGLVHYNTLDEIHRLDEALQALA